MSSAEQIINLLPTLDEDTCQQVLSFINSLQKKFMAENKEKFDDSLTDRMENLIQKVQNVGEISDCDAEELALSYLEDKYSL